MRSVPVWLLMVIGVWSAVTTAPLATGAEGFCRPAELFVADDGSPLFELQADVTIALNGAAVTGSTPLDGAFWSDELQQVTFELARQFHLCVVDESALHTAAEALRRQFNQQTVLTFDYLPKSAADAVTITVPDVDIGRFHAAFVSDSAAQRQLLGGSVTTADHVLILVAGKSDLDIAHRLVTEAGADWASATIEYGNRDLAT